MENLHEISCGLTNKQLITGINDFLDIIPPCLIKNLDRFDLKKMTRNSLIKIHSRCMEIAMLVHSPVDMEFVEKLTEE